MTFQFLQFPTKEVLEQKGAATPSYMRPNTTPLAIIGEAYLEADMCDEIIRFMDDVEPYRFPKCHATTREAPHPLPELFDFVVGFPESINQFYWNYDLDKEPAAFYQTYVRGDSYQLHMDGNIAQSRKLTAVVMLSPETSYSGGELTLHYHPVKFKVPKTRGTIAVFQPWMLHEVSEVTIGKRHTLNIGFWGPPFK